MKMFLLIVLGLGLAHHSYGSSKLQLLRKIPHKGYSEGLDFHGGFLWHALPHEILKIDPKDGTVIARFPSTTSHSESVMWFQSKFWNLSFATNGIYSGKGPSDLKQVGATPEEHGWGITHDGESIILTGNYSPKLYFLDPKTLKVRRTLQVAVSDLEDLAFDGKWIWTSSFTQHRGEVFRVDPKSGAIGGFFQIPLPEDCPIVDGLAIDGKTMWITGKECPAIYLVKIPGA